jgi:pimeloyl-ACP methyl ester carboxylesterase
VIKILALFTFVCVIFSAGQSSEAQKIDEPLAKQVSVNGTTIRYWEQGQGVPVVFVHGAFSDHRIWEPQREAVAKRYRFIAIDQRYFGTAPWSDTGAQFSPTTHISDLAAFIRALNAGPVYLVGCSYGASIALATTVRHPDLVRGLLLNEPQSIAILADPSDQKIADEDRKGFAAIRAAAEVGRANEATKLFYEWVNDQRGGFDALPAASRGMFLDNARTVALQVSSPPTPTTCVQAGQLKVPVTITKGELTRTFFRVIAEATSRCIPGSKLITIKGARHGAPAQQPAAFNQVLLAFLGTRQSTNANSPAEGMLLKKLKVNDIELAYREEGNGATVLFVHGSTGDWRTWEPLRPFISDKYHYVSLSRRYHYPNRWTDDGKNYSMTQHVEDLAAFIRVLNVGKVHLVGNSGGGRIVGHVALKYPELVRSVVMGESGLISPTSPEGRAAVASFQENNEKVLAAMKAGDAKKAMRLHYDAIAGQQGAWEKLPLERQRQRLDNATTVIPTLIGSAIPVTCEELNALSVPALVIGGEKSPAYFRYRDERLLSCLPRTTRVAVIPGAHHEWYAVNPEASAKAILNFLADQRQAQPVDQPSAKQISINGATIRYWKQGKGVPGIFVHSATGAP